MLNDMSFNSSGDGVTAPRKPGDVRDGADVRPVDPSERRRHEILRAASKVIAQKGYHATNIADIARELGAGHGTFYRYFRNKRDIAERVVERTVDQVVQAVVVEEEPESADTAEQFTEQIRRLGQRIFQLFIDDPELAQVFFFEAVAIDREMTARMRELTEVFAEVTARYLRNGVRKGFLRPDLDVETVAYALNGMVWAGATRLLGSADPDRERERWVAAVTGLVCAGVLA